MKNNLKKIYCYLFYFIKKKKIAKIKIANESTVLEDRRYVHAEQVISPTMVQHSKFLLHTP